MAYTIAVAYAMHSAIQAPLLGHIYSPILCQGVAWKLGIPGYCQGLWFDVHSNGYGS